MASTPITSADLRTDDYARDPFPVWRRLRHEQPLFHDAASNRWILTRYDDVVAILRDPTIYSARTYQERFRPVFGRTLAELDGPRHIRERTIVAPAFVGRSLDGYRPFIEQSIARLTDRLRGRERFDLVEEITGPLPLTTISTMLGFPDEDTEMLIEIGDAILKGLDDSAPLRAAGNAAHRRLGIHLSPLLDERRATPSADLISRIVHAEADGKRLTDEEICSFVSFLLVAGGPTTDMAIRNLWWTLLSDAEQFAACRNEPDRVQRAFAESLRRDGPIIYEDRRTNAEVEWHGTVIPADSDILVCLGSANTDDSVFADPETFDPDRTDLWTGIERKPGYRDGGAAGHVSFGLGSHFCMGYQLARAEVVAATEQFLLTLPTVRLTQPQEMRITWYERTVDSLPVAIG